MSHYYATLDDVQRRMPQFQLTPVSKPKYGHGPSVSGRHPRASSNTAMENLGYVTPITGPKSLAQCKEISPRRHL